MSHNKRLSNLAIHPDQQLSTEQKRPEVISDVSSTPIAQARFRQLLSQLDSNKFIYKAAGEFLFYFFFFCHQMTCLFPLTS